MVASLRHVVPSLLAFGTALSTLPFADASPNDQECDFSDDPLPTNTSIPVRSLGALEIIKPGFLSLLQPHGGEDALFISSFAYLGVDQINRVNDIAASVENGLSSVTLERIPGNVTWPNDVTLAPKSVFGTEGVLVGGGFLAPTKNNGGIWFSPSKCDGSSGPLVQLAGTKENWFYHKADLVDVDRSGNLSIVSCRARLSQGPPATMLVILQPEDRADPFGPWVETEIGTGCDALFTIHDLDNDGIPEIISTSFFAGEFNLYHTTSTNGFADAASVRKISLDRTIGAPFDVQVVDVNGDGKLDLLVSNHQGLGASPIPAVYAYEIPANITNVAGYTRHLLASGFPVTQSGVGQASPGSPTAFFPDNSSQGRPYIALAGDAAQIAYVLVPGSAPQGWDYTTTILHNCGCTVGKLAVGDVDGDGKTEIYIPCYDNDLVVGYTFAA
ncbi:hypothetical protein HJFPF1_07249 [Paramyrothecium foliicola]|nr:hypothetical protein HJFPF1_07249 [Paramyrothecium foliicola]